MTDQKNDHGGEADGRPEQTDNSPRDEDGEQDVSQDPDVDYAEESVVPALGDA
jgi:hypothetical protein